jgi:hypothetical protein
MRFISILNIRMSRAPILGSAGCFVGVLPLVSPHFNVVAVGGWVFYALASPHFEKVVEMTVSKMLANFPMPPSAFQPPLLLSLLLVSHPARVDSFDPCSFLFL